MSKKKIYKEGTVKLKNGYNITIYSFSKPKESLKRLSNFDKGVEANG